MTHIKTLSDIGTLLDKVETDATTRYYYEKAYPGYLYSRRWNEWPSPIRTIKAGEKN